MQLKEINYVILDNVLVLVPAYNIVPGIYKTFNKCCEMTESIKYFFFNGRIRKDSFSL